MDRLDTLSVFIAVAEQGSFIAAARQLGRSPAAVTRAVAALEDRLAARLLTRTTRAVALTEAGQLYLDQAELIRQAEQVQHQLGAMRMAGRPEAVQYDSGHVSVPRAEFRSRLDK